MDTPRLILWCYAIWYGFVLIEYFDPTPRIWITSLGLSAIVGYALLLSTRAGLKGARLDRWSIVRLFLMPFCVSSFAALVKGRGFILIFAPSWFDNLFAATLCTAFVGFAALCRRY